MLEVKILFIRTFILLRIIFILHVNMLIVFIMYCSYSLFLIINFHLYNLNNNPYELSLHFISTRGVKLQILSASFVLACNVSNCRKGNIPEVQFFIFYVSRFIHVFFSLFHARIR